MAATALIGKIFLVVSSEGLAGFGNFSPVTRAIMGWSGAIPKETY
jgi:hypothetical protein